MSMDIKPHAYDPATQPELFEGVLARRVVAFVIDFIILAVPVLLAAMFIFAFGIVTLGLGFALYWLLSPCNGHLGIALLWRHARRTEFRNHRDAGDGSRNAHLVWRARHFVLGAVHAIAFWFTVSFFTPFVLLVAFFNQRRRLLHDILLGTVIINNASRASMLRGSMQGARAG
jgi:uncharacterized RDD family membrane protein YckC